VKYGDRPQSASFHLSERGRFLPRASLEAVLCSSRVESSAAESDPSSPVLSRSASSVEISADLTHNAVNTQAFPQQTSIRCRFSVAVTRSG